MAFKLWATSSLMVVLAISVRAQFNGGAFGQGNNDNNGFGGQGSFDQGGFGAPQSPFGGSQSQFGAPQSPFGAPQSPFGGPQSQGQGPFGGGPFGGQGAFGANPFATQSPFGSPFGAGFPNLNFGPGGNNPGQQGILATVRAVSPTSGDRLYLTLRQVPGNQQNPFLPFPRPNAGTTIRVSGYFSKGGYDTGVTSPNSLQGIFLIAVARYGNIDGGCVATGPVMQRNNNPFSLNPFGQTNPFSQFFQGQRSVVSVSTPLRATAATSNIDGEIDGQNLEELFGASLIVCGDNECRSRTDLCGTIVRDGLSIDEYTSVASPRPSTGVQPGVLGAPLGNPLLGLPGAGNNRPVTNSPQGLTGGGIGGQNLF